MNPCKNFRPFGWDDHRCVCGAMLEAHPDPGPQPVHVHVYQDRVKGEGFVLPGLDVDYDEHAPTVSLYWHGRPLDPGDEAGSRYEITIAQAEMLRDAIEEVLRTETPAQDPVADAAEDEAFAAAIRRMEEAEAREDAYARPDPDRPWVFCPPDGAELQGRYLEHVRVLANAADPGMVMVRFPDGYEAIVPLLASVRDCTCKTPDRIRCFPKDGVRS